MLWLPLRKRYTVRKITLLLLCLPLLAQAQVPVHYYDNAANLNGEPLRQALYNIIKGHTQLAYSPDLWDAYTTTDVRPDDGKVWDIYSDIPGGTPPYEYTFVTNQCGNGANHENSCYNREHLWPQSKFGSSYPMYSDLWIAYPTDYYVNGKRADYPYGKVTNPTKTFLNGTKLGPNAYSGAPSGTAFEPIDSFKGDIARSYFYITTRYLGDSASFQDWEMAVKSTLKPWAIAMLLEWHHNDPVSQKEIDRNNAAANLQHNRNPFIDNPMYADCIWGTGNCNSLSVGGAAIRPHVRLYPNPAVNTVSIDWPSLSPDEVLAVDVVNMQGQVLYHSVPNGQANISVPVAAWAHGLYLVQVKTSRGVAVEKLDVE